MQSLVGRVGCCESFRVFSKLLWRAAEAEYHQQIKIEVNSEYRGGRLTHVGNPVQVGLAKTLAVVQVAFIGSSARAASKMVGPTSLSQCLGRS